MENRTLKISVITAAYNSGKTIEDTLKSVFGQTYPDVEPIGYGVENHGYNSDINYLGAYAYGYVPVRSKK